MALIQDEAISRSRGARRAVWFAVLVIFGGVLYIARPQETTVPWMEDLAQAQSAALRTGRHILIQFHKPDDPAVVQMDREVFMRPEVHDILADWIAVRVDVTRSPKTAEDYEIDAWPTYIALAPDGVVLGRCVGKMTADAFVAFVRSTQGPPAATRPH